MDSKLVLADWYEEQGELAKVSWLRRRRLIGFGMFKYHHNNYSGNGDVWHHNPNAVSGTWYHSTNLIGWGNGQLWKNWY